MKWIPRNGLRFLHQSNSVSATDKYSGHSWNWQLWHSEKIRLGVSTGSTYQPCHILSDMGQVTSICLHLNFLSAEWVCVSPGLCSVVTFLTFPCSAVYWEGSPHRRSGHLASGWVGLQEALAGDRVGREEAGRLLCPSRTVSRVAGLFVILRAPSSYHLPFPPLPALANICAASVSFFTWP